MSDEWMRSDSALHQTNDGDVVQIRLDSDPLDVAFSFNPAADGVAAFYRWLGIAYTPSATTPALKLRPKDDLGENTHYPLLLIQDDTQANLAKWEASGSIDLIRKFLKNAGQITFQSEVAEQTQYTCMFESDGDFYWAVNAYVGDNGRWYRRDTSRTAYLMVVWAKHDVDPPALENPSGPMWYVCPPGQPDPISDVWQGLGGWLTGLLVTEDRNLVLGGANLEVDGYGNVPHGRFIHVALDHDASASRTVIVRNAYYYSADEWKPDAENKACAAFGFLDDGSLHCWYHEPTADPFPSADWVERMSLTAAGRLVLGAGTALRRLNVYDTATVVGQFRSSDSSGTRLDIQTNSGSAASNAVLLVRNPDATGAAWEVGLNSAAAAPLTNAFCWSLSAGVTFSAIRMSLSTGGVLNVTGSYQVGGVQVVGAQQPHIANADGTIQDITTKFNTLLAQLERHGLLASEE